MNGIVKSKSMAFAIAGLLALGGCNTAPKSQTAGAEEATTANGEAPAKVAMGNGSADAQTRLMQVYTAYGQTRDALFASDSVQAHAMAVGMAQAMPTNDSSLATLGKAAQTMATAPNMEAERMAFSKVSDEMASALQKVGLPAGTAYVQHCPMAFESKGANWVSAKAGIENPYFGSAMPECGETKLVLEKK